MPNLVIRTRVRVRNARTSRVIVTLQTLGFLPGTSAGDGTKDGKILLRRGIMGGVGGVLYDR